MSRFDLFSAVSSLGTHLAHIFFRPSVSVKIRRTVVYGILVSSAISRILSRRSPISRFCTAASYLSEDSEIGLPGRGSS